MRVALVAVSLLAGGARLSAQAAPEASLVRCADGSSAACVTTTISLTADLSRRAATATARGLVWRARFLGDTALSPVARRGRTDAAATHRLLLLVDVSGSMKRVGAGTARIVVREFLRSLSDSLPPNAVRVAVAPFGSVSVAPRIDNARFTTPDSAQLQLDALPLPDQENTGLYSAVELGIARVTREAREADGGLAVLAVITDGDNDVDNPGDDPGLLAGEAGLARAARAVDQSAVITNVIGIGNLNAGALRALAGTRGRSRLVAMDAFELAKPLGEVRDLLWSSWELAIPLNVDREALGRGYAPLVPALAIGTERVQAGLALWRPPVVALPAFAGVVPPELTPPGAAAPGGAIDRRLPLAGMVLVLLSLLWLVIPRVIWPPFAPAAAKDAPAAAKASPSKGGLRTDVKEAAPRRPTDVTAARARRA